MNHLFISNVILLSLSKWFSFSELLKSKDGYLLGTVIIWPCVTKVGTETSINNKDLILLPKYW